MTEVSSISKKNSFSKKTSMKFVETIRLLAQNTRLLYSPITKFSIAKKLACYCSLTSKNALKQDVASKLMRLGLVLCLFLKKPNRRLSGFFFFLFQSLI